MEDRRLKRWLGRIFAALLFLMLGAALPVMITALGGANSFIDQHADVISAIALWTQVAIFLASAYAAWRLYKETKDTAARNNTLSLIFEEHTDRTVAIQRKRYKSIRDDDVDRLANYDDVEAQKKRMRNEWTPPKPKKHLSPERYHRFVERKWRKYWRKKEGKWRTRQEAIIAVMNRYEAFAIGIQTGAIDEAMYKRWWKSQFIRDWYKLRDLVSSMQKISPNAFIEFQSLAEKWQEEETKARREKRVRDGNH